MINFAPLYKKVLKNSFLWACFLVYFETVENFSLFSDFLPRKGLEDLFSSSTTLKFLIFPVLKLAFFTFLIYFSVMIFAMSVCIVFSNSVFFRKKCQRAWKEIFYFFSMYIFNYLLFSYNFFLHPAAYQKHPILYRYLFPHFVSDTHCSVADFVNIIHIFFLIYWLILILFVLVKIVKYIFRRISLIDINFSLRKKKIFLVVFVFLVFVIFFQKVIFSSNKDIKYPKEKNVIFIGIDSLQYNQILKEWGAPSESAPDILNFIKDSTYFTNSWTSFARTTPAYFSILTGLYPVHHGVRANLCDPKYESPGNVYLGDILRKEGYYSFYATDDPSFCNLQKRHGFDKIFTPRKDVAAMLLSSFYSYAIGNIAIHFDSLPWVFDCLTNNRKLEAYNPMVFSKDLINEIDSLPDRKKKFIVVHLCSHHYPYTSLYPYARNQNFKTKSERCLSMVNDQFSALIKSLKRKKLFDNSDIFLLSDHGSGWEEKQKRLSHGSSFDFLWDYKNILAVHSPKINKTGSVSQRVRIIDIFPTVLDMLNIPQSSKIDGKSLLPLMEGKVEPEQRSVFCETGYTINFIYYDDLSNQANQIQGEFKNFRVDPETGYVYIKDSHYREILMKKWFMMIDDNYRLISHPWEKKVLLFDANSLSNDYPIEDENLKNIFLKKLRKTLNTK